VYVTGDGSNQDSRQVDHATVNVEGPEAAVPIFKARSNLVVQELVFLLSSWYSGTTLLTLLLDRHPDIVSNGEGFPFSGDFQGYDCTCGYELRDCDFYRMAASHMDRGEEYDRRLFLRSPVYDLSTPLSLLADTPHLPGRLRHALLSLHPRYRSITREFAEAHELFMNRALEYSNARVYLDGTKSLRRADILLQRARRNGRIWLLIKDCRGYCATVLRVRNWPQDKAVLAAKEWLEYIRLAKRLAASYPEVPFRILRYEDLCADPAGFLHDLVSELGLDPHYDWHSQARTPHVLGNKMRKGFDGTIRLDERWRSELEPAAQTAVVQVARRVMEEFGYVA
jgi:hypothetical protein